MIQIFLSYSRRDRDLMETVKSSLEGEGFTVWTDDSLETGTPRWKRVIAQEIEASDCMVVMLSPDAYESVWVENETSRALKLGKRIFPVLLRGEDMQSVPLHLENYQYQDLRADLESGLSALAAAIRGQLMPEQAFFQPDEEDVGFPPVEEPGNSEDAPELPVIGTVSKFIANPFTACIVLYDEVHMGDLLRLGEADGGFEQRVDMFVVGDELLADGAAGVEIQLPVDLSVTAGEIVYKVTNVPKAFQIGVVADYDDRKKEMVIRLSADLFPGDKYEIREDSNLAYSVKIVGDLERGGRPRKRVKDGEEIIFSAERPVKINAPVYRLLE